MQILSTDSLGFLNSPRWQRWLAKYSRLGWSLLVIVGVLGISAFLATRPSSGPLILVGGGIAGLLILNTFMRWPALGLVALVPGSMVVAFSVAAGSQFSTLNPAFLLVFMLLGLWLVDMLLRRELKMVFSRPYLPLLIFVAITALAFGYGQLSWYSFAGAPLMSQLGGVFIVVVAAGAFILVGQLVRDERWLQWMTWLFIALGALQVAELMVPGVINITDAIKQPGMNGRMEKGLFQYGVANGSMFWTWLVALALSQALFNRTLKQGWRLALAGVVAGTFYYALFMNRGWVSGYAPPLVTAFIIIWVGAPQFGPLVTLAGIVGGAVKMQELISNVIFIGDNSYSLSTRLEAWGIVWQIAKVNPLLGLGPSNYYFYSERFPIRGYHVKFNSHSNYIDLIAQTGLLGLAAILWFFAEVAWLGLRLRTRVPEGTFARAYVYGALGGLGGMVVAAALGDWVLPFVYNIGFPGMRSAVLAWLFLGGLVALEQIYRPEKTGDKNYEL
jgi:hypothetical protein